MLLTTKHQNNESTTPADDNNSKHNQEACVAKIKPSIGEKRKAGQGY